MTFWRYELQKSCKNSQYLAWQISFDIMLFSIHNIINGINNIINSIINFIDDINIIEKHYEKPHHLFVINLFSLCFRH